MTLDIINGTFQFFEDAETKYAELSTYHKLGVLSLNAMPIKQIVCNYLLEWRKSLGQALLNATLKDVFECRDRIDVRPPQFHSFFLLMNRRFL